MLELQGHRIVLREFSKDNLYDERYYQWLRDPEVVLTINRIEYLMPIQFSQIERYVQNLWQSPSDAFFALYSKENNEFIGTQRISQIDWRTGVGEIGIMVGNKAYWGKGVGTDAISTACAYAFHTLSLRRLIGGTPETNTAMCKCFEKVGFKEEGRHRKHVFIGGNYIDRILYGLFKEEFRPYRPNA